nr:hypothetical protein C5F59_12120 [Streptomyces sp. QL37]
MTDRHDPYATQQPPQQQAQPTQQGYGYDGGDYGAYGDDPGGQPAVDAPPRGGASTAGCPPGSSPYAP